MSKSMDKRLAIQKGSQFCWHCGKKFAKNQKHPKYLLINGEKRQLHECCKDTLLDQQKQAFYSPHIITDYDSVEDL